MPLLSRVFMALGATFVALSVAVSAAAAHVPALQQGAGALAAALQQQQLNAVGMVLVGLVLTRYDSQWLVAAGCLLLLGLLLFCLNVQARVMWGWTGARALVPVGGSAFILAWVVFALGVLSAGSGGRRR